MSKPRRTVVILTLDRHKDGIWIRRLVEELYRLINGLSDAAGDSMEVSSLSIEVRSLEAWMAEGQWISPGQSLGGFFSEVACLVNRVSDAAPPALFKACTAFLTAAQIAHVPTFNGPISYNLCASKWCQHLLFQKAKLESPPTALFYSPGNAPTRMRDIDTFSSVLLGVESAESGKRGELLIKPNAGGFGAGIRKTSNVPDEVPAFDDCITLLQKYYPPKEGKLYRIWFLNGKIQCAVERTLGDTSDEFSGACTSSTCARKPPALEAFYVPKEVKIELEGRLLPHLRDAHCGSVEYLISESGQRLYFDLNLLSTLPVGVSDPNNIWRSRYNPWQELALAIISHAQDNV